MFDLVPAVGACALVVPAQAGSLGWLLWTRLAAWLGRISYSLYLIHIVVMHLLVGLFENAMPTIDLAPVGIAPTHERREAGLFPRCRRPLRGAPVSANVVRLRDAHNEPFSRALKGRAGMRLERAGALTGQTETRLCIGRAGYDQG